MTPRRLTILAVSSAALMSLALGFAILDSRRYDRAVQQAAAQGITDTDADIVAESYHSPELIIPALASGTVGAVLGSATVLGWFYRRTEHRAAPSS